MNIGGRFVSTDGRFVNTGERFVNTGDRLVSTDGRFVKKGGRWKSGCVGSIVPGNISSGATGSGIIGRGFGAAGGGALGPTGMGCAWLSCIRRKVGGAGLELCADRFKTTIMLIKPKHSSVRMILCFIYGSMWLHLPAANLCPHPAFDFKLRAGLGVCYGV